MSSHLKAELAVTCSTLGRLHRGEYLIEPECIESVKDLIRYLKRDDETHEIRRYLGESKVLQNDLIHIIKSCPENNSDLFDVTLRLLINLTTPAMLFYGEEIPAEKIARNIYLSLIGYSQDYKLAFCDVEFWNKICGKLTDLFEIDWAERSVDDGIQIERILMLLRNVLQVPADVESEKRPENDITVHDKVLWALRQSQILELLLFISSNLNEEQYFLNLLEIFSLILREQNPKFLAECNILRSVAEKNKDSDDLMKVRESEKKIRNKYVNMRNFNATFVMKGVKSLSRHDVVCHKSLDKVNEMDLNRLGNKRVRVRRNRVPVESERTERRSTFSVRLFLKEFCLEFLNSSFSHLMNVVKNKLDSGKSLANDQTYYFWALNFFLDFATTSGSEVNLIKDFLSSETFHFVQTSMDSAFDHLNSDKKKTIDWIKRIHLILKAYRSLLETLMWMDSSKNPLTRSISREIKSQIFYVVEYREMTLHLLLLYDSTKFSVSYLRDLIETTHLFIKLLEDYSKQTKLVVQKITKKKLSRKKCQKVEQKIETREEKWEKIKDDVYDTLCSESCFPEIPPFDAALEIPIDDQKGRAMKNIQKLLHEGKLKEGIGLLRSARQVWPENDYFGTEGMSVEDETMALQEICLADMGEVDKENTEKEAPHAEEKDGKNENEDEDEDESENEGLESESRIRIVEQDFDIMDYKKRLVNKKVVEGCGILLKNYNKNSDHTNHCVMKLLHRIGWECCMPAMLFQASLFWTLLKIMRDKTRNYQEINTFTVNLLRKFRKCATKNSVVFLELLFWKEHNNALEIQHGYGTYEMKTKPSAAKKSKKQPNSAGEEKTEKKKGRKKKNKLMVNNEQQDGNNENLAETDKKYKKTKRRWTKKKKVEESHHELSQFENITNISDNEGGSESADSKSSTYLSSVLNNSDSDSDEKEIHPINQSTDQKNLATLNGIEETEEEEKQSNYLNNRENQREVAESLKTYAKHESTNVEIFSSSDEENDERRTRNILLNESSSESRNTKNIKNSSSRRRAFIESSDDEEQDDSVKTRTDNQRAIAAENLQCSSKSKPMCRVDEAVAKLQEDFVQEKENYESSSSQKSNASSKKRSRQEKNEETENSSEDEGNVSKSKRIRFIGSDSEMDDFQPEDEKPIYVKGVRRKIAIIDSDSDVEENSLDEK